MKKYYFILAAAALGFASCSNDETIESAALSEANEINFRPLVSGVTRAADQTLSVIGNSFQATAFKKGTTSDAYFSNVTFTKVSGGDFTSTNKYYWPSAYNLDFYAYAPASGSQLTPDASVGYKKFTVVPSTTISEQIDLIYARTNDWGKNTSEIAGHQITGAVKGVTINFRHAESKVVLKVKNGQNNLKIEVLAFKFANVDGTAIYEFGGTSTDTKDEELLPISGWSGNTETSEKTVSYTTPDFSTANIVPASQSTAEYLKHDGAFVPTSSTTDESINMILIPQTTSKATAYSASTADSKITTGSYIAVKMKIRNNDTKGDDGTGTGNGTLIEDATAADKWAIWPVDFTWVPGKIYTYTIDLGDGGYWESNHDGDNTTLDPVLEGSIIKFVSVTVDDWTPENINVPAAPVVP